MYDDLVINQTRLHENKNVLLLYFSYPRIFYIRRT